MFVNDYGSVRQKKKGQEKVLASVTGKKAGTNDLSKRAPISGLLGSVGDSIKCLSSVFPSFDTR